MSVINEFHNIQTQLNNRIIGQEEIVEKIILAVLCNGNVLLEGNPGTGKTTTVKHLASLIGANLGRIQFTPDLLPSDVVGSELYLTDESGKGHIEFSKGPVFNNLLLADEINRAPSKVQSALLEAMEERQVTVNGLTYKLPQLFMVLATQNPIEQDGTYPLPEAQLDRFIFKLILNYPSKENEMKIMQLIREQYQAPEVRSIINEETIFSARNEIQKIKTSPSIDQYIVDIVDATRSSNKLPIETQKYLSMGLSTRTSLSLDIAAKAKAWLSGSEFVNPDHIRSIIKPVLRHRLYISYEAIADGVSADNIIDQIIDSVAIL
ncbi:ATPase, AAA family [Bacteriovorax sp. BAL6_X]|uniref:AAA family ATPase n=1 Tax=Bacteriovorax sp. BAL6_X TaxID=1201290 RepID=UPI00038599CE|nr:MoxR family ATPase [Bacteriovorax sp. BAL6_X]EPZ50794.1 ATPase, AAA family [Bacteriovorax sp. BAL6_X]